MQSLTTNIDSNIKEGDAGYESYMNRRTKLFALFVPEENKIEQQSEVKQPSLSK